MDSRKAVAVLCVASLSLIGCSGEFLGGGAAGALGAGAGYELKARQQMQQLEEDYNSGKIGEEEYNIRKDQIERGSLAY